MASRASTSTTSQPTLALLSDPPQKLVDAIAYEYFLIEMVSTLRTSAAFATARSKATQKQMSDAGLISTTPTVPISKSTSAARDSLSSPQSTPRPKSTTATALPLDEEDEPLRTRLTHIGQHAGANLAEKLSLHRAPFADTLDLIKFVCKDLWSALFNKQIDNLRTNHRGVYVLQDNAFKPIQRVSSWGGRAEGVRRARVYAVMAAGTVGGALARLGYPPVSVTPEISALPNCTFQVRMPKGL